MSDESSDDSDYVAPVKPTGKLSDQSGSDNESNSDSDGVPNTKSSSPVSKGKEKAPAGSASGSGSDNDSDGSASDKPASKRKKEVDSAASSSSEGEMSEPEKKAPAKKRLKKAGKPTKKSKKLRLLDDQALEEDKDSASDNDEDQDSDDNEYLKDGFVVSDEEEGGERSKGGGKKKKLSRLRRTKDPGMPDEEDLELVRDAQIRAGRLLPSEQERQRDQRHEEGLEAANAKDLEAQLFDDAGGDEVKAAAAIKQYRQKQAQADYDSDSDDFIEDDTGQYTEERRRKRRAAGRGTYDADDDGPTEEQLNEAMEIFGEEDETMDYDFEKPRDVLPPTAGVEPVLLMEFMLSEVDQNIQNRDRPERLQLRMKSRGEISEEERKEEARWILPQLALQIPYHDLVAHRAVEGAVEKMLHYMRVDGYEVPFIAQHRKDWYHPHLLPRHLWRIYDLDEKWWVKIGNRRENVARTANVFWRLDRDGSDDEGEGDDVLEGYASEDEATRAARVEKEQRSYEEGQTRLRRATKAAKSATDALTTAQEMVDKGAEKINEDNSAEHARAVAERAEKAPGSDSEDEGTAPPPPLTVTDEELQEKLAQKKEAQSTATQYLAGLQGELSVEDDERKQEEQERRERRRQRLLAKREEQEAEIRALRESMAETASLFPSRDSYKTLVAETDEDLLKDLQEYLSLVLTDDKPGQANGGSDIAARRHIRASRTDRDLYKLCRKEGLRRIADQFSISAIQLGEGLGKQGALGNTMLKDKPIPPTPIDMPPVVASEILGSSEKFQDQEAVMKAVRHMLGMEIAAEPRVKRACRELYRNRAMFMTKPTALGKQTIDFFHPAFGLQHINHKYVRDYLNVTHQGHPDPTQFLRIEKARKDGLLEYNVIPPQRPNYVTGGYEVDFELFFSVLEPFYNPQGRKKDLLPFTPEGIWADQRRAVLRKALESHLLPALKMEVLQEMRQQAREMVAQEAAAALQKRIEVAPWAPERRTTIDRLTNDPYERKKLDSIIPVGIFVSADSKQPSYAVVLDPDGNLVANMQLPARRDEQNHQLKEFLKDHRPGVVVVSTSAESQSQRLGNALYRIRTQRGRDPQAPDVQYEEGLIPEALQEYEQYASGGKRSKRKEQQERIRGQDYDGSEDEDNDSDMMSEDDMDVEEWKECEMHFVRDDVATIYAASPRSSKEFPETHANLRAAICLARCIQEPLAEYAGMWRLRDSTGDFGQELLSLNLHPLQKEVAKPHLLRVLEQRMVDAVNDAGVDINLCCNQEHMHGLLQFVAGLGPRKAKNLMSRIAQDLSGVVTSRNTLLSSKILGPLVYTNCAGFLRIRKRGSLEESETWNPLDDSRIHTECYVKNNWAATICCNALDTTVQESNGSEAIKGTMDDSRETLIMTLKKKPTWQLGEELHDKLHDLDISDFAQTLDSQGLGKHQLQFEALQEEIRFPYRERRVPFRRASAEELFEWITGETDATLRPGIHVTTRVIRTRAHGVHSSIEGHSRALLGYIARDQIDGCPQKDQDNPEYGQPSWLEQQFPTGLVVDAVVQDVRKANFEVKLSLQHGLLAPNTQLWTSTWYRPPSLPPLDNEFDMEAAKKDYETALEEVLKEMARTRIQNENEEAARRPVSQTQAGPGGVPKKPTALNRSIVHDNFRNLAWREAEKELLENGVQGEFLFRPSSRGPDHLTLTWMWLPNKFYHIEIREKEKGPDPRRLGAKLFIYDEEYEDLDEIIARFVVPCNAYVQEMLEYPKFRTETRAELEASLIKLKEERKGNIPYAFAQHKESAGYFELLYVPGKSVKSQNVKVVPNGYSLPRAAKTFRSVNELVAWFKTNAQKMPDKPPEARPRSNVQQQPFGGNQHAQQQPFGNQQPPLQAYRGQPSQHGQLQPPLPNAYVPNVRMQPGQHHGHGPPPPVVYNVGPPRGPYNAPLPQQQPPQQRQWNNNNTQVDRSSHAMDQDDMDVGYEGQGGYPGTQPPLPPLPYDARNQPPLPPGPRPGGTDDLVWQ